MGREPGKRLDIRAWYPEARSVLVCAFAYPEPSGEARPGAGRVSNYAALPDYHEELRARMDGLADWVRARGGDARAFVDTSPVLERLYARLAGIAWLAKNTMAIAPRLGSYHFLAGLATTLELEPDEPETDHCGSCRRCLDACPTDAFPEPRVLDASRCVSYLTIENRGQIPEGLRAGVGDWVYGCDICQEVCPWNRFSKSGEVFPVLKESWLDLEELASLDEAAFKKRFADSPMLRAKRRGLVRNALLAMGNSGDARHRATLERYASDPDPILAEQARWSLSRLSAEN